MSLCVGVDLGGTNVRAGLVSGGRIMKLSKREVRGNGTEAEVFADVCSTIDAVIDDRVKGIGIGVPSLVNPKDGTIFDTTNIPAWKKVPLRRRLEKRYGVPVRVDNDANCFALGERHFGCGKTCGNFVGLIIGTGLGAGIISRGHLHSGRDCGAGEFGLIPYRDSILEHYASGQFFRKFRHEGEALAREAGLGDPAALGIFEQYGEHLGHAVKLVLYALAPEMIVFGGSVSESFRFFEPALKKSLGDFAYPTVTGKLKLKISKLKNSAVLGASSLVEDAE